MDEMPDSPTGTVDGLKEAQKECLRLYYRRYDAKEIALQLGIAPVTVHQRLTSARRHLGVSGSIEAARVLAEAEGTLVYDDVIYDEISVAEPGDPGNPSWLSRLPWPLPTRWRVTNDRTFQDKLAGVIGLAILFMIAAAIYLLSVKALSDTV